MEVMVKKIRTFTRMAKLIKSSRVAKGLSQSQLSEAVGYANGQFVSNVERGLCSVPAEKAQAVCSALSIQPNDFLDAITGDFRDSMSPYVFGE
jgi:transcriptional regulator with XRE-family HTH domain